MPLESAAWIATGVRYRDNATADPPSRTLQNLPRRAVIVWAVIYEPEKPTRATRFEAQQALTHLQLPAPA